jgi:hypothetical protein
LEEINLPIATNSYTITTKNIWWRYCLYIATKFANGSNNTPLLQPVGVWMQCVSCH